MRHKRGITSSVIGLVLLVSLAIPSPAFAFYWDGLDIIGLDSASMDTIAGVAGNARIPSSYSVLYQHVSSVYSHEEGAGADEMVEIGWVAEPPVFGNSDPYYFESWMVDGNYYTWPVSTSTGKIKLTKGANPRFSVRPSSVGSTSWNFYLDGMFRHPRVVPFSASTPEAASERDGTEDTNWSYFSALRKCSRIDGAWWDWKTLDLSNDYDPYYHATKVNESEFYVTVD